MRGAKAWWAPSRRHRHDLATALRAFRPTRLAAALLFAASAFLSAPSGAAAQSADELYNEYVGTDGTAPRIESVLLDGGDRGTTVSFHVTFTEPVLADPGDFDVPNLQNEWFRVERRIGPHYDEQDRLMAAGDPFYKPCNPDDDYIISQLGLTDGFELFDRLDRECLRREDMSRHWRVTVGGSGTAWLTQAELSLVPHANNDIEDAHGNRLDRTLPAGNAYQIQVIDRRGPNPRLSASVTAGGATVDVATHDGFTPIDIKVDFGVQVNGFRRGDLRLRGATLTSFTGSDGSSVYTIRVTPSGDSRIQAHVPRGVATDLNGHTNDPSPQLWLQYDPIGVSFTPGNRDVTVPEGSSRTYSVVLEARPLQNVTIDVAKVAGGDGDLTLSGSTSLTFTRNNWDTPQTVRIAAAEDNDCGRGTARFSHTSSSNDPTYNDIDLPTVAASENDNDPDCVAPRVRSIERSGNSQYVNANSLVFDVTFSEDVQGVGAGDFNVTGTSGATAASITGSGDSYAVTVSGGSLASHNGAVGLSLASGHGITDQSGNVNRADNPLTNTTPTGANEGYTVDNTAPTVTLARADGLSTTLAGDFNVTVTFTETNGLRQSGNDAFARGDLDVNNGSVTNLTGSGLVWTATIRPTAGVTGNVTVDLPANAVRDRAGNGNTAATQLSVPVDNVAPTLATIEHHSDTIPNSNGLTNADRLFFSVTFSEAVRNVDGTDFAATGVTGASVSAERVTAFNGAVWTVTVSGSNVASYNGTVGIALAANHGITDTAGNALAASTPSPNQTYTVDNTAPTVTLARADGLTTTLNAAFNVTVTFTEANGLQTTGTNALAVADFDVTNGSVTSLTGNGLVRTATVTPSSGVTGNVTVRLPANAVRDAAGNGNTAAPPLVVPVDTGAPSVLRIERHDGTSAQDERTNADTLTFRVTFSESVTNVSANGSDFDATGTSGADATGVTGSGATWIVTVGGGTLGSHDGAVGLSLASGQDIADAAGNGLGATLPTGANNETYTVDNTAPTPTLDTSPDTHDGSVYSVVNVRFGEAVTGFAIGDIGVTGGSRSDFTTVDATHYTVRMTPSGTADMVVSVAAGAARDLAGNASLAADDVTVTYVEALALPAQDDLVFTVGAPVSVTFEPATGGLATKTYSLRDGEMTHLDLALDGLTFNAGTRTLSGTPTTATSEAVAATFVVFDSVNLQTSQFTITINAAPALTAVGNRTFTVGTDVGTVELPEATGGTAPLTYTLEGPSGAALPQGLTFNATADPPSITGTPQAVAAAATYTYKVEDANGASAEQEFSITVESGDTTAPTVVSILRHNGTNALGEHTNADTLTFQVTFSESVENVSADGSDFDATGTSGADATGVTGSGATWIVTVGGGTLGSHDGAVGLTFASNHDIEDAAENDLTATLPTGANNQSYTVDNTAPTVTTLTAPDTHNGVSTFNISIVFSEDVNGFDAAADLTLTGGSLTSGASSITRNSATSYTANITPSGNDNVTVTVAADAATDAAGNGNAVSATETVTYAATDSTAPTVVSILRDDGAGSDPGKDTNADTLQFKVTFSESVKNAGTADFAVTGTTATATGVTGSGSTRTVTIGGGNLGDRNGEVGLTFAAGQDIADGSDNALTATLPTGANYQTYTVDNTAPTVTTFTPPASHDGSTAFNVSIVFSEDVTGFDAAADLTVTGDVQASRSITRVSDSSYTASITPAGTGDVTVQVAADAATDAAGNGNAASASQTVTYTATDTTDPTVLSIVRDDGAGSDPGQYTNADTLRFKVTFSEPVENVNGGDFFTAATGLGSLTFTPTGSGAVYDVSISGGNVAGYNGAVGLTLHSSQDIADGADNALDDTLPTGANYQTYTVDNTRPTVALARQDGLDTTLTAAFNVTVTFTEANGLAASGAGAFTTDDIGASGGEVTGLAVTSDPLVWTAEITPTGSAEGDVVVSIDADVVTDRAGNGNTAATDLAVPTDTLAPLPRLTASSLTHDGVSTSVVTIDFFEAVNGFTDADIDVTGGSKSAFTGDDGDSSFTVTVTPTGNANIVVEVGADVATDLAGNNSRAPGDVLTVEYVAADATLSTLTLAETDGTAITLSPTFAAGTTEYTASVDNDVETITVAATATDDTNATVEFDPATDADTSTEGHQVSLDVGENDITVTVTNGGSTQDYTITVTRAADTTLSALGLAETDGTAVTLDPVFAAATTEYTATVGNDVETVTVEATATDDTNATLEFDPADEDTNTNGHQVGLDVGENEITVTVSNGGAEQDYTITVTREAGAPATPSVLVSNLGQSHSGSLDFSSGDQAQAFTTGDSAGGYTLTAVDLQFHNLVGPPDASLLSNISASVWSATGTGQPDTKQGDLTSPSSLSSNVARFTTSGIDLEAETTYVVVFDSTAAATLFASVTDSDDEDSGAASGWSIADGRLWREVASTTTTWTAWANTLRIAIVGTPKSGTATTALDWSATLTIANTTDDQFGFGGDSGSLTPDSFTPPGGTETEVDALVWDKSTNGLYVATDLGLPDGWENWTLQVGSQQRSFGDAQETSDASNFYYTWTNFFSGTPPQYPAETGTVTINISSGGASDTATEPIWSATLDVNLTSGLYGYDDNYSNSDDLTPNKFTPPGGSEITVQALEWDHESGNLEFWTKPALPSGYTGWTLHIGDDKKAFSSFTEGDTGTYNEYNVSGFFSGTPPTSGDIAVCITTDGSGCGASGGSGTALPAEELQARFLFSPDSHSGMPFWTELRFSAPPKLGYRDVRDRLFEVTGGRIARAQRLVPGSNLSWRLLVEPDGFGDIALSLPPTADCEAERAVCTKEGARLLQPLALAVPGPGDRLAARIAGHEAGHDGEPVELELHFNQRPKLGYRDVRDRIFEVTGGTIRRAQRLVQGSNLGWRLTVAPEGAGAVTLTLPPTEDCAAEGAVCTPAGKRLEQGIEAVVEGPAAFSVSDAEANEDTGAVLVFDVSLNRRLNAEARVDVSTRDGTAKAGADYEAVTKTLVFAPGETLKIVTVPVLDDAHDEGSETMTLALSNATGAPIADGEGIGTITNSDAIPKAWIARFGRTVTGQVLDAVEERLAAPRRAGIKGRLAGQALPSWDAEASPGSRRAGRDKPRSGTDANETASGGAARNGKALAGPGADAEDRAAMETLRGWMARADGGSGRLGSGDVFESGEGPSPRSRTMNERELLLGTSFAMTAGSAAEGGHASLWGRVSAAGFDGREDALSLDGKVTTGLLGADWASEDWTAGLALGHSAGTGGYRRSDCGTSDRSGGCGGKIEAELTGLYPYAGMDLSERVSVWLAAGHGSGDLTVRPDRQPAIETDLTMSMGAAGTRVAVLKPEGEGLNLALKGDGRLTRTSSDAASGPGGNLAAAEADVWMLRIGLDGSRRFRLGSGGDGASLTPSFEVGVRRDGGDAETGFGTDMGGGLAFADPKNGLNFDVKGRALVAHEASGFREWGASAAFGWDPRPSTDRGPAMSLSQSRGASPSGGMNGLLDRETMAGLAANDNDGSGFRAASRLEGELGYGMAAFGGRFTGKPNLGFGLSDSARDYRVGWRLTSERRGDPGFEVNLDATRREPAGPETGAAAPAEHGVALRALIRW